MNVERPHAFEIPYALKMIKDEDEDENDMKDI